jgi:hypothetical protein
VRPGDSYASPTSMSSKNRRGSAMKTEDITPNWRPGRAAQAGQCDDSSEAIVRVSASMSMGFWKYAANSSACVGG